MKTDTQRTDDAALGGWNGDADSARELVREHARLREAAKNLREHLESPACMVRGFDVPDEIWLPFTSALDLPNAPHHPRHLEANSVNT